MEIMAPTPKIRSSFKFEEMISPISPRRMPSNGDSAIMNRMSANIAIQL